MTMFEIKVWFHDELSPGRVYLARTRRERDARIKELEKEIDDQPHWTITSSPIKHRA